MNERDTIKEVGLEDDGGKTLNRSDRVKIAMVQKKTEKNKDEILTEPGQRTTKAY